MYNSKSGQTGLAASLGSQGQGWIHEIARAEIHPDAERVLQLGKSYDPHQMVEESAIDFLTDLRECFTEFSRAFNAFAEGGARFQEIKIFSVAQTAADFMLFRNQIKLLVSNSAHGVIQVSFAQHVRGGLNVDGQGAGNSHTQESHELLAQIGAFRDIYWTYQGERVTPEQVAKFYFIEFSRITRDTRATKQTNQVLLDQIRTLLHEKGLDL